MDYKAFTCKFQCPGCLLGDNPDSCDVYEVDSTPGYKNTGCKNHTLGTQVGPYRFALGLPVGFNRPGFNDNESHRRRVLMRFWQVGEQPKWNKLNIAVWALEKDDFLFVRTYMPRIDVSVVDVIHKGKMSILSDQNVLDVAEFQDEID